MLIEGKPQAAAKEETRAGMLSIEFHTVIDTTQRRARELVERGDRRYDAVCADHQTAGRGRQGESWHDASGQSLLASLILWDMPLPEPVGVIGICAALATAEALEAHYPDLPPVRLKYPNDLIALQRKLGGVLVEIVENTAIVGVGVNIGQTAFPTELEPIALSVWQACGRQAEGGAYISQAERAALIETILSNLRALTNLWREQPAQLHALWQARDDTIGRAYRVQDLPYQPIGMALGVNPKFQLTLRLTNGEIHNTYYASAV
jgi:BirA family transcriptional regulator, biotin operon repressor / biotin---[acetyl-CoA-carboxylase] ligase